VVRAGTPFSIQCVRVLQGQILAAVYAKYRSAGRTTAKGLILSDLSPEIKLIYQFYIKYYEYYQPYIPEYGHGIQVI
jgi:hypothetical protein